MATKKCTIDSELLQARTSHGKINLRFFQYIRIVLDFHRIVDTVILLGRHGLLFRGQRESLTNPYQIIDNFLKILKFLSQYDSTIQQHLEKVTTQHQQLATKRSEKPGPIGRSILTF